MFCLYNTCIRTPDCCNLSLCGSFTKAGVQEILLCRGNRLELYVQDEDSGYLSLLHQQQFFGNIRSINRFNQVSKERDYICVGGDSGRIVIFRYNKENGCFVKIHQETFGKTGCRRSVPGQYLAVDSKGRCLMIGAIEKEKFVYVLNRDSESRLTISSPLCAHKPETLCFFLVDLDVGYDNPCFACIEFEYGEYDRSSNVLPSTISDKELCFYELDLGLNHVVKKWKSKISSTSHYLLSVPGGKYGPSGVLVISNGKIVYKNENAEEVSAFFPKCTYDGDNEKDNDSENVRKDLMVVCSSFYQKKKNYFWLVQIENGDLFKVSLNLDKSNGSVVSVVVNYFDTLPTMCCCMNIMKSGYIFCVSEHNDHVLYHFDKIPSSKDNETEYHVKGGKRRRIIKSGREENISKEDEIELTNLSITQQFESIGPIIGMYLVDLCNEGFPQYYIISGKGKESTFNIVRHGVNMKVLVKSEFEYHINDIWVVKDYIVLSTSLPTTNVFKIEGNSLVEMKSSPFFQPVKTLNVMLFESVMVCQVFSGGILLFGKPEGMSEKKLLWENEDNQRDRRNRKIVKCCYNPKQLLICMEGGILVYFEFDSNRFCLEEISRISLGEDISSLSIFPIPKGRVRSDLFFIGFYNKTVKCYSLSKLFQSNLTRGVTSEDMNSLSVLKLIDEPFCIEFVEKNQVIIGLTNGIVYFVEVDINNGSIINNEYKWIGIGKVSIKPSIVDGLEDDKIWFINCENRTYVYPPFMNIIDKFEPFISVSCIDSKMGLYVGSLRSKNELVFFNLNSEDIKKNYKKGSFLRNKNMVIERYKLNCTPRKFINNNSFFYIIESEYNIIKKRKVKRNEKEEDDMEVDEDNVTSCTEEILEYVEKTDKKNWLSYIRVFDSKLLETTQLIELKDNYSCFSLCLFNNGKYLVVGCSKDQTLLPLKCTCGSLNLYEIGGNGILRFIHSTILDDLPQSIVEFEYKNKVMLLCSVNNRLVLFNLGKKRFLKYCESVAFSSRITDIKVYKGGNDKKNEKIVTSSRIFVSTMRNGIIFVKYKGGRTNNFFIFSDSSIPRYIVSFDILDYHSIVCSDKFGNVFIQRLNKEVEDITHTFTGGSNKGGNYMNITAKSFLHSSKILDQRPLNVFNFYTGDLVTKVLRSSFFKNGGVAKEVILYSTITGGIYALIPLLNKNEIDSFKMLEMHLRQEINILSSNDHLKWRSSYFPVQNVVDGELVNMFNELSDEKKEFISSEMSLTVKEIKSLIKNITFDKGLLI